MEFHWIRIKRFVQGEPLDNFKVEDTSYSFFRHIISKRCLLALLTRLTSQVERKCITIPDYWRISLTFLNWCCGCGIFGLFSQLLASEYIISMLKIVVRILTKIFSVKFEQYPMWSFPLFLTFRFLVLTPWQSSHSSHSRFQRFIPSFCLVSVTWYVFLPLPKPSAASMDRGMKITGRFKIVKNLSLWSFKVGFQIWQLSWQANQLDTKGVFTFYDPKPKLSFLFQLSIQFV